MKKTPKKQMATQKKIKIDGIHTKKYLEKLKTTYKDEKVVFVLPDGREIK